VIAHSQGLSGLTAGTVYHYRVKSRDAAGNLAVSGDFTFTTTQSGSIPLDGLASLSYNAANNQINTSGFAYDPAGNQIRAVIDASGTQQQYRYDCAGRLAQVLDGSGNVLATYSYGAGNRRLMSVEGGVTKYFAWAGGQIIAEYEAWGTNALIWKTSYVYLGGRLLATTSGAGGNETRFHHPDRLGGTRLVTGPDGTVVTEQLSMPFGTMLPFTQTYGGENSYQHPTLSNPSKKRFTSYDRSDVTTLDYAVNRFYSPQQGRFTQVDPIEMSASSLTNPQTLNLYSYCGNDPINHVDPDGLFFGKLFGWIGKAFKFLFKVAAVALVVAAIVVLPGSAVAGLALLGLAGAAGLAGWHNGKLGTIAGRILSAGVGWKVNARTPGTFPKGAGVGGVSDFVSKFQDSDNTIKKPTEPAYRSFWEKVKHDWNNEIWPDWKRRMETGEGLPLVGGVAGAGSRLIRIGQRWRARSILDAACRTGCDDVAKQIQKHIGGEIIEIVPAQGKFLGAYRGHDFGWYYHKVVVKGGHVYDAFTGHQGLPIIDYKKLWQFADSIKFGF
jgi:RHS repeat-associated protein